MTINSKLESSAYCIAYTYIISCGLLLYYNHCLTDVDSYYLNQLELW